MFSSRVGIRRDRLTGQVETIAEVEDILRDYEYEEYYNSLRRRKDNYNLNQETKQGLCHITGDDSNTYAEPNTNNNY